MKESLINLLKKLEITDPYAEYISNSVIIILLLLLAYLSYILFKPVLIKLTTKAAKKSKSHWDDVFLQTKFFHRITLLIPALVVYISFPVFLNFNSQIETFVAKGLEVYFLIIFVQIGRAHV